MQRHVLREAFAAAVARCQPGPQMLPYLPDPVQNGRLIILAAGKAAGRMAEVAERHYRSEHPRLETGGVVVLPDGADANLERLEILFASHPLPDERSVQAAVRILAAVRGLRGQDQVLMLLSGGASSLLCAPAEGITLEEKRAVTQTLIAAGAPIDELNAVRQALSAIKGGKLARACWPATVTTLAVSDVVGDDPLIIGSAPTMPTEKPLEEIRSLLSRYGVEAPASVRNLLENPPAREENPFPAHHYHIVVRPMDALEAAASVAESFGYTATILGDDVEGEAAEEARRMANAPQPDEGYKSALLSGGEVTVTFDGNGGGYGGPNREFALALAIEVDGRDRVAALVADSDGSDGQCGTGGPVAGALIDSTTVSRGAAKGLDAADFLRRHDSGSFFERLGDEIVTGPTHTNVNDFRMLLLD